MGGVSEDSNEAAVCNEPVWDGPYRMTCRRTLVNGKCGRHGTAKEPGGARLPALSSLRSVITGVPVPVIPSWLLEPLWDQFAALLPPRPVYAPSHPLGCHRRRIPDRIVFEKLLQVLRFGCSYEAIADASCSATTLRSRRDEWIEAGIFARLKQTVLA